MPVQYVQGDLLASPANILVIPVSCDGVVGKGKELALQCKQQYPEWFVSYKAACENGLLSLGFPFQHAPIGNRFFVSFPTKYGWCSPALLGGIQRGLEHLVTGFGPWLVPEYVIAFPKLGCGAGGLSWSYVQPSMGYYLCQLPCTVLVYV